MGDGEAEGGPHQETTAHNNDVTKCEGKYQKIRKIVTKEFDIEILHKWRELRILEDELDKAQQLRLLLEKLILNGMLLYI